MPRQHAFTLIELLITLTIVMVLLSLATPNLRDAVLDRRLAAAVRALEADLLSARGAAVFGSVNTVACPGDPIEGCVSESDWSAGWLVFVDTDGDREFQSGDSLLRTGAGVEGVTINSSQARRRLRFSSSGAAPGSNGTLRFCDARGSARTQQLRLSNSGRLRHVRPPESAGGVCP